MWVTLSFVVYGPFYFERGGVHYLVTKIVSQEEVHTLGRDDFIRRRGGVLDLWGGGGGGCFPRSPYGCHDSRGGPAFPPLLHSYQTLCVAALAKVWKPLIHKYVQINPKGMNA